MDRTDKMERRARRATSPAAGEAAAAGFTLLEIVCALAILGLVASVLLPAIPRGTSRTAFESYAVKAAAILKQDRTLAMRQGAPVRTLVDPDRRTIASGATGASVVFPADVAFSAVLAQTCRGRREGRAIEFFPSGLSCGGAVILSRLGFQLQIRVNWLTGGVEIVSADAA